MDSHSFAFAVFVIIVALAFDFINGFHDAANSIATVVSTRVLKPRQAVLLAAFFNFVAAFFIGVQVAKTVGTGIINPTSVDNFLILAALVGSIAWNLITWWLGLPSSSSHGLIGGLIGAGLMKAGTSVLVWKGIIKTACFIVISPTVGLLLGLILMTLVLNIFRATSVSHADWIFRRLQLVSSSIYSISHGMNDAQKTMGVISMVLFTSGLGGSSFDVPYWVEIACYTVLALGTMAGGWRIVKTMGTKITKLQPMGGCCAESAAAISIIGASIAGIPVSTTHTITGAIMGVGATKRLTAVRWGIAGDILWAWVLTIPISAVISAVFYVLARPFFS
jgi:inorganic phosphate transporter, PiT family